MIRSDILPGHKMAVIPAGKPGYYHLILLDVDLANSDLDDLKSMAPVSDEYLLSHHLLPSLYSHEVMQKLTPRQRQVFSLLKSGLANKEIANELGLSLSTVKLHVSNILSSLKVNNRTQAVLALTL